MESQSGGEAPPGTGEVSDEALGADSSELAAQGHTLDTLNSVAVNA